MTRHRGHGSLAVSRWIGFCLLLVLFRTVTAINVKLTLTNFLKLFEHYEKQSFLQTNSKAKIPTRTEVMTDIGHTEIAPLPVPQLPDKPKSCFGLPAIACQNTQDMVSQCSCHHILAFKSPNLKTYTKQISRRMRTMPKPSVKKCFVTLYVCVIYGNVTSMAVVAPSVL